MDQAASRAAATQRRIDADAAVAKLDFAEWAGLPGSAGEGKGTFEEQLAEMSKGPNEWAGETGADFLPKDYATHEYSDERRRAGLAEDISSSGAHGARKRS